MKGPIPNAGDTVVDGHIEQSGAVRKGIAPDVDDVVANRYAAQPGAIQERARPDSRDRESVDRLGNGHAPLFCQVFGEGNRAVSGRIGVFGWLDRWRRDDPGTIGAGQCPAVGREGKEFGMNEAGHGQHRQENEKEGVMEGH